jgi:hypothetical protein
MVITSECLFLIYFVSFRQSHKVEDKRKYWKVVKVKALSRGKSLIDSRWVKLRHKTGIFERYYARIVVKGYLRKDDFDLLSFERMISTFWASKGWFRPFEPFALTLSHVTARLASQITAIPGFFAYDYDTVCAYYQCSCTSTETSLREKRFQDILSRMMSVSSCSTQFMASSSWRELPTFFAKKCTLKLDLHSLKLMSVAWYWWKVMWRVVQHPSHPRPNRT